MSSRMLDRGLFSVRHAASLSAISTFTDQVKFLVDNSPDILLRINSSSLENNVDTFVFETSSHPNDELVYTSSTDKVDLNIKDGGFF